MTSEEIRTLPVIDLSTNAWLKEIALQIALLREQQPKHTKQAAKG